MVETVSYKTQGFHFFINIPEVSRRCDVTPEVETVTYRVYRVLSQQVCVLDKH